MADGTHSPGQQHHQQQHSYSPTTLLPHHSSDTAILPPPPSPPPPMPPLLLPPIHPLIGAWAEFLAASRGAADLDGLITAHERFLAGATARALLGDGAAEALRPLLAQLLRVCMGLHPLTGRFNERVCCMLWPVSHARDTSAAVGCQHCGRPQLPQGHHPCTQCSCLLMPLLAVRPPTLF